jgi:hypothetical protein
MRGEGEVEKDRVREEKCYDRERSSEKDFRIRILRGKEKEPIWPIRINFFQNPWKTVWQE